MFHKTNYEEKKKKKLGKKFIAGKTCDVLKCLSGILFHLG